MRKFLQKLTNRLFKGMLLGVAATVIIQSSSAISIMSVEFVNAKLMRFRQAVSIILGSILGSSITGWIVCLSDIDETKGWEVLLSTGTITSIVAIIGIILRNFTAPEEEQGR